METQVARTFPYTSSLNAQGETAAERAQYPHSVIVLTALSFFLFHYEEL